MSLSRTETLEVSAMAAPAGFPSKVRERLSALGAGQTTRDDIERLCGTASAANQFIDKGVKNGYLVPVGWGSFEVPRPQTLHRLARLELPHLRRLVSWSSTSALDSLLFAGPRLWRDTNLALDDLLPVAPLSDGTVHGLTPQWQAFHMDVDATEPWQMVLDGDVIANWTAPSAGDLALLMLAAADPRWRLAIQELDLDWPHVYRRLRKMAPPQRAPQGNAVQRAGAGPPQQVRLLAPKWYMDRLARNVQRQSMAALLEERPHA